jgi:segregation and condensation protein A
MEVAEPITDVLPQADGFAVRLPRFEGPLDLLLFFVQRDEIAIRDLPIAQITREYLVYVRALTQIDLDAASDFIYFAALLIDLKIRMLLPRPPAMEGDEGSEGDPRAELVERLIAYVQMREAAALLDVCRAERSRMHVPPPLVRLKAREIARQMSPTRLVLSLRRLLTTAPAEPEHEVRPQRFTIERQLTVVGRLIARVGRLPFARFVTGRTRRYTIASLLAVLELVRRGQARIRGSVGDFNMEATPPDDEVA